MEIDELLNLSPSRRILLAQKLWDSVSNKDIELSDSVIKELERRIQAHQRGEMKYYTREELKEKLQGHPLCHRGGFNSCLRRFPYK